MNGRGSKRSTIRVVHVVLALLFLLPIGARAFDLLDAYRLAVQNDPTIMGQRQDLAVAVDQVRISRSALLPSLGANSQLGRTGGPVSYTGMPLVDRTFNAVGWTVQLNIPLLHVQDIEAYRESHRLADQANAQFSVAEQDLIIRVVQAYFGVLVAQESLAAATAQIRAATEQRIAAKHRFDTGVGSITDVDEAATKAAMARYESLSARSEVQSKRADLEKIIGSFPDVTLLALRDDVRISAPDPAEVDPWVEHAREDNPSVMAGEAAVDAAGLEVERARAQRLPTLDLVGSYGRNYSSGNNVNPIDFATNAIAETAMLQFNMPIVDGGAMQGKIAQAGAKEEKAQAQLDAARRQVAVDARDAFEGVMDGLEQIRALRFALDAGIRAVTGNRKGYRVGLRTNLDVLDAQRQRYAAQRDLAKARYETLLQSLKLKAAAGALGIADLLRLNAMLTSAQSRSPAYDSPSAVE